MGFHAHEFFANVAALGKDGGFLEDTVLVGVRAHQFLHALLDLVQVGARDGGAVLADFRCRRGQALHSFAELAIDAAAFLGAHGIQLGNRVVERLQHRRLQLLVARAGAGIHRSRHFQDGVQVGLRLDAEFLGDAAQGFDIAADQLVVEGHYRPAGTLDGKREFHVPARQLRL